MTDNAEIKELAAQPAAVVRFTAHVSEMGEHLGKAFGASMQHIQASGAGVAGPPFAYYEQLGGQRFDVRAGFPVTAAIAGTGEVEAFELPAGPVATMLYTGSYTGLGEAYEALAAYANEAGYAVDSAGPSWEEYLSEPDVAPEETQTVVYMPVKRR